MRITKLHERRKRLTRTANRDAQSLASRPHPAVLLTTAPESSIIWNYLLPTQIAQCISESNTFTQNDGMKSLIIWKAKLTSAGSRPFSPPPSAYHLPVSKEETPARKQRGAGAPWTQGTAAGLVALRCRPPPGLTRGELARAHCWEPSPFSAQTKINRTLLKFCTPKVKTA